MSNGALFANNIRASNKNLVEVKAGKMIMKGKTVYPDNRKGQLYLYQSDDSLMHFCWKDRLTGVVEDDLIIFPDDCEFRFVPECETGKVYLLKFKSSCRKFFFWIQDLKPNKGEECCQRINEILNNPPSVGSQRGSGNGAEGDLQNLLNNMSQQQLMQLFGGVGQIGGLGNLLGSINRPPNSSRVSTTSSTTAETSNVSSPSVISSRKPNEEYPTGPNVSTQSGMIPLASVLGAVNQGETKNGGCLSTITEASSNSPAERVVQESTLKELHALVASEISSTSISHNAFSNHLPPGDSFSTTICSPQFSQAFSSFWSALHTGQAAPVVQQFGFGSRVMIAANNGDIEEFIDALQETETSVVEENAQAHPNREQNPE